MRLASEDMSKQFAEMLKETYNKMQEKIEIANTQWEKENENTSKKFEDLQILEKEKKE